jgi:hypothetical protein
MIGDVHKTLIARTPGLAKAWPATGRCKT